MSGATTNGLCWGCQRAYARPAGPIHRLTAQAVRVAARASSFLLIGALMLLCGLVAAIMVVTTTDHVLGKLRMVAPSEVRAARSANPAPPPIAPAVPAGRTQADIDRERQRATPTPPPAAPAAPAGKTQGQIDRERLWGTPAPR